jgi:hypothetical protein
LYLPGSDAAAIKEQIRKARTDAFSEPVGTLDARDVPERPVDLGRNAELYRAGTPLPAHQLVINAIGDAVATTCAT